MLLEFFFLSFPPGEIQAETAAEGTEKNESNPDGPILIYQYRKPGLMVRVGFPYGTYGKDDVGGGLAKIQGREKEV